MSDDFDDPMGGFKNEWDSPVGRGPEGVPQKQVISRRLVTPEDTARARADKKKLADDGGTVVMVDENDPRYQAAIQKRRCGDCVNFDNEAAVRAMKEQNFVERLVKEETFREEWFKEYSAFGVCWAFSDSEGLRVNEPDAPGICAASDLDSSKPMGSQEGSEMCLCPYYENRKDRGRFATSSAAGVRGPTVRDAEARRYVLEHDERRRRGGRIK